MTAEIKKKIKNKNKTAEALLAPSGYHVAPVKLRLPEWESRNFGYRTV